MWDRECFKQTTVFQNLKFECLENGDGESEVLDLHITNQESLCIQLSAELDGEIEMFDLV